MIPQLFLEVGHARGKASKGCEKEEESNKESSKRQRLASLFFFYLSIIKGIKVDFLLLFLRQLPYISGIEQFYIYTNPCNNVHIGYASLCTYCTVRMMDMHFCVHMVLCTYCICSVMCIWCFVHVVNVVLCTYGVV